MDKASDFSPHLFPAQKKSFSAKKVSKYHYTAKYSYKYLIYSDI